MKKFTPEKLLAVLLIGGGAWFLYQHFKNTSNNIAPTINIAGNVASDNVPYYLYYNAPTASGFTASNAAGSVLPSNSIGQDGFATKSCAVCSLFPSFSGSQL